MTEHLSDSAVVDVIDGYSVRLERAADIARRHGITRQGVYKILRRNGITTAKGKVAVSCDACGAEIRRTRGRLRKQKRHFCGYGCYYAFLEARQEGSYQASRQGQRIARARVAEVFDLQPGHIVHHEDRNNLNNSLDNLRVFANQGDHIRYHRLGPDYAQPIWDGSKV